MENKIDIVINYIKENIDNGKYKPSTRLISEQDFAKKLGVSRSTIREAFTILSNDGLIIKKRGSGNYISENAIKNSDKYMIVILEDNALGDIKGHTARIFLEELKEEISKYDYKLYTRLSQVHEEIDILDTIPIAPANIAGVFTALILPPNAFNGVLKNKIPVISVLNTLPACFNCVNFDFEELYEKFNYIKDKYNFKNNLIIHFDPNKGKFIGISLLIHRLIAEYLGNNNANNIISIPWNSNKKDTSRILKENLLNINYIPDAIFVLDDNIFIAMNKIFDNIKYVIEKSTVIVLTDKGKDYLEKFQSCKIEFDLSEMAKKSMELMQKMINKEYIEYTNETIEPKILNEEILRNIN